MAEPNLPRQSAETPRAAASPAPGPEPDPSPIREVVGMFPDAHALEHAVEDLFTHGFDHGDLSLLAGEDTLRKTLGHRVTDTLAVADNPETPRRAWVEPETRMEGRGALASILGYVGAMTAMGLTFATGGAAALAAGAALVGGGAGAGLGIGLGRLYDQRLARQFEDQIRKGGILVWVRVGVAGEESQAAEILARHGARHVHAHSIG